MTERFKTSTLVVIGGGPAGMAAAERIARSRIRDFIVLEKEERLGGVLRQCIHDGFGITQLGKNYTGPEYASLYEERLDRAGVTCCLGTTVIRICDNLSEERGREFPLRIEAQDKDGRVTYLTKTAILASGCRERGRGMLAIPGTRPAGIYTAGTAQALINLKNIMPGRNAVILGSGDIGLIMARRLTLEGGSVQCVLEKEPVPGGLPRNVAQCLEDFSIPLHTNTTVTRILGDHRVEAVEAAELNADGRPIEGSQRRIPCDTLILSVGLIPENSMVDTEYKGLFVCGNAAYVHDLVDRVAMNSEQAAEEAIRFLASQGTNPSECYRYSIQNLEAVREEEGVKARQKRQEKLERFNSGRKTITCILCPNSCEIGPDLQGGKCGRGAEYVRKEILEPSRVLTTTLRRKGTSGELVSVRSAEAIPKTELIEVMSRLRNVEVSPGVRRGERIKVSAPLRVVEYIVTGSIDWP